MCGIYIQNTIWRVLGILLCLFAPVVLPVSAWNLAGSVAWAGERGERGPEFPWSSFARFWNVRALPGAEIKDPQRIGEQYITQYGHSVTLIVSMQDDVVRTVTAQYSDPAGQRGGGQRWLKLVDTIITVGTYRWPYERLDRVRERFMEITPQPATYTWQNSSFRRSQNAQTGWEFQLEFLTKAVFDAD